MTDRKKVLELFEENKAYMEDRVNAGIEQNRKGWGTVLVRDQEGNPVPGAKVQVKQTGHAFRYGANIFMLDELETPEKNAAYKEHMAKLCNTVTLPFYWNATEPERGKKRYDRDSEKIYRRPPIDLCMDFCEEHGIEPREHGLAYATFVPDWLKEADTPEVKRELEKRCQEIAEKYADKIPTIEVTNEMFWERKMVGFYEEDDYIEYCFKLAEKYFPANKLCINEWAGLWEGAGRCTDAYYSYIKNAMNQGARIDAVGMQFHMFFKREQEYERTRKYYDPVHLYKILDRYGKLGKPLQITEITIPAYSWEEEDEAMQAKILEYLYAIWFSHENVEEIIYWNMVDGYAYGTQMGDMTCGENYYYGGLFRFDLTPKPAYFAIRNLFEKKWHTQEELCAGENGKAQFKGFYGTYEVEVTAGEKTVRKQVELKKLPQNQFEIVI